VSSFNHFYTQKGGLDKSSPYKRIKPLQNMLNFFYESFPQRVFQEMGPGPILAFLFYKVKKLIYF
jgi:hypothetical protein